MTSLVSVNFPTTVAVAVKSIAGKGSRRAFRWAVKNLVPVSDHVVLVHVMPFVTSVPTPSGDSIPIEELNSDVVEMYVQDMKVKAEEILIQFKKLCHTKKIETLVLESDNPASALLMFITDYNVKSLVLGSCTACCITGKLKASGVPSLVIKHAPEARDIYIVSRNRLITTSNRPFSIRTTIVSDHSHPSLVAVMPKISVGDSNALMNNYQNYGKAKFQVQTVKWSHSVTSTDSKQSEVQAEVENLRLELSNTVALYNLTCDDLVLAQNQVRVISSHCLEETRQVKDALKREETFKKIAAKERDNHLQAAKEADMAKHQLACEAYERQIAELKALRESIERQKLLTELFSNDRRYKRYSRNEIEMATDLFSEAKKIGEGAYGKVYICSLDNMPVAVKVLRPDALEKKDEFLREVEVLCQLRHPNIVLLLGACPEIGCLVYEYMERGSLEDHISKKSNVPSLPWFIRFRIIFEIARGLAFLHNSKPVPIIHRDLKPGNIFINRNCVSKIGDVGLAKLFPDNIPDNITEYSDSVIAGTLYYIDPEYQRTGTVRPKSDIYAFGIIILQLLTGRHPNGVLLRVEDGLKNGHFSEILDKSIEDWPVIEAEELARMGLKCSKLRCRDRPDLDTEILPVLKKLADFAEANSLVEKKDIDLRGHYLCPILQEVMNDPHIAADGFTYEHRAIKAWLEKHHVSFVTKNRLQHKQLIPDHTLRSAIQKWKSHI